MEYRSEMKRVKEISRQLKLDRQQENQMKKQRRYNVTWWFYKTFCTANTIVLSDWKTLTDAWKTKENQKSFKLLKILLK